METQRAPPKERTVLTVPVPVYPATGSADHEAPEKRQRPVVAVPPKIAPACEASVVGRLAGERPAVNGFAADCVTTYGPQLDATRTSGHAPVVLATAVASPQPSGRR